MSDEQDATGTTAFDTPTGFASVNGYQDVYLLELMFANRGTSYFNSEFISTQELTHAYNWSKGQIVVSFPGVANKDETSQNNAVGITTVRGIDGSFVGLGDLGSSMNVLGNTKAGGMDPSVVATTVCDILADNAMFLGITDEEIRYTGPPNQTTESEVAPLQYHGVARYFNLEKHCHPHGYALEMYVPTKDQMETFNYQAHADRFGEIKLGQWPFSFRLVSPKSVSDYLCNLIEIYQRFPGVFLAINNGSNPVQTAQTATVYHLIRMFKGAFIYGMEAFLDLLGFTITPIERINLANHLKNDGPYYDRRPNPTRDFGDNVQNCTIAGQAVAATDGTRTFRVDTNQSNGNEQRCSLRRLFYVDYGVAAGDLPTDGISTYQNVRQATESITIASIAAQMLNFIAPGHRSDESGASMMGGRLGTKLMQLDTGAITAGDYASLRNELALFEDQWLGRVIMGLYHRADTVFELGNVYDPTPGNTPDKGQLIRKLGTVTQNNCEEPDVRTELGNLLREQRLYSRRGLAMVVQHVMIRNNRRCGYVVKASASQFPGAIHLAPHGFITADALS
jgi:hypothetical protein